MPVLLALCASALFGVADFCGGSSARRIHPVKSAAVAQVVGLVILLGALAVTGGEPIGRDLLLGAVAGFVGAAAIWLFYRSLALGTMSVVAPVSALTSAVVPVVVGLAIGENPSVPDWIGICLALPAVVLISREQDPEVEHGAAAPPRRSAKSSPNRAGVASALAAGAGFGTFVVLVTRTSMTSGLWPLVSARAVASLLTVTAVGVLGLASFNARGRGSTLALIAGVLDATATVLFLEAGRRGLLVLVGVIVSLYPASTVLLARVVLAERLARHQMIGLAMAAVAVVLVAL